MNGKLEKILFILVWGLIILFLPDFQRFFIFNF